LVRHVWGAFAFRFLHVASFDGPPTILCLAGAVVTPVLALFLGLFRRLIFWVLINIGVFVLFCVVASVYGGVCVLATDCCVLRIFAALLP
jgi:hypothetical protein